ncbi:MAG TPA: hypothetical protein VKS25_10300 [Solirubrobacteraceae bacterium]|nr:hypothetical protein [Solirubrobacteraceae bacterium]
MNPDPPSPEPETRRAVIARDAGLRRISSTTRWIATAVVALSGGLALIASNAFHGRAATTATQSSSTTTPTQQSTSNGQQTSSGAIQQPAQAPQSTVTQQQPVVVSGGS